MEKQGVVRRKRLFRPGLLGMLCFTRVRFLLVKVFFLLAFLLPFGFKNAVLGADEGEALEVQIETSPANPIVNSPWSVYILAKHPSPREVNVEAPRFPSSLALERVRAEIRTTEQGERWTRVEYLFTPLRAETITLDPFEVKTPTRRGLSAAITVSFREETSRRRYEPRFRWLGSAPSIAIGEKGELLLELINWDPVMKIPQGLFQGKAPFNAILEESLPYEVREGVFRYIISLIPLESTAIKLEPVSFNFDIYALTVPEINVPVLPVRPIRSSAIPPEAPNPGLEETINLDVITQDAILQDPFNAGREKVFFLFRGGYNQVINRARSLWVEDRRAEALAELRRNERDSLSGPFIGSLRSEIEQMLGFDFTEGERWSPLKIPLALWGIFGFLLLSAAVFFFTRRRRRDIRRINDAFRKGGGFVTVGVLILVLVLLSVFLEESLGGFPVGRPGSSGRMAVLRETQGYRIPDLKGAVSDHFDEGQPVIIGDHRGSWCFAETPDGRSGWVPSGAVIAY